MNDAAAAAENLLCHVLRQFARALSIILCPFLGATGAAHLLPLLTEQPESVRISAVLKSNYKLMNARFSRTACVTAAEAADGGGGRVRVRSRSDDIGRIGRTGWMDGRTQNVHNASHPPEWANANRQGRGLWASDKL